MAKKFLSLADLSQLIPSEERVESRSPVAVPNRAHDGKGRTVRVFLETNGRKGKTVTVISGLQHNPQTMDEISRMLKQYCGAGGTVKEGNIEVQGNHCEKIKAKLRQMNYSIR